MPQAITPSFTYEEAGADELVIHYRSARKLCAFMEGLLDGVALYFQEEIQHEQRRCMHTGSDHCEFALKFSKKDERTMLET
jgi:hypothetical protein